MHGQGNDRGRRRRMRQISGRAGNVQMRVLDRVGRGQHVLVQSGNLSDGEKEKDRLQDCG